MKKINNYAKEFYGYYPETKKESELPPPSLYDLECLRLYNSEIDKAYKRAIAKKYSTEEILLYIIFITEGYRK